MKDKFPEYYRPSEQEFSELWKTATFVFDANVLLDIYRYSPKTSEELLGIMVDLSDRVWLPHQFAFEYHKHLDKTSSNPPNNYDDAIKQFKDLKNKIETELNKLKNRTRLDISEWMNSFDETFTQITDEINHQRIEHDKHLDNQDIPSRLDEIFIGKIGDDYSQDDLNKIYREGKERFKRSIPPGYKDTQKGEPDCYNDLVAWKQIINFAKREQTPIILVTGDTKEDWFKNTHGTKSPRPELIKEMRKQAGVSLYLYPTLQFMEYARNYLDSEVSEETLDEVETVQENYAIYRTDGFREFKNSINEMGVTPSMMDTLMDYKSPSERLGSRFAQIAGLLNNSNGLPPAITDALLEHISPSESLGSRLAQITGLLNVSNGLPPAITDALLEHISPTDYFGNSLYEISQMNEAHPPLMSSNSSESALSPEDLNDEDDELSEENIDDNDI